MSVIFVGGRVYTGAAGRFAEALVAKHGRVRAVGDAAALRRDHPDATPIDLRGGLMVPGFTDAHCHFLWWAVQLGRLDLSEERTLDAALAKIDAHARRLSEGAWILGGRFDKNLWGRWPTADELDRVSHGHPAALRSRDGHARWVDHAGLRAAKIDRDTPTPEGGEIDRDDTGAPSGILRENAIRLVDAVVPQPTFAEALAAVRAGQREALRRGLTSIHDLDNPLPDAHRGFQELRARGELALRVNVGIPHRDLDAALALGVRTGLGDEWIRWSNLKMFADGALGSQTAALEEPYEGRGDYRGVLTLEPDRLARDVRRAAEAGIAVAIHAIGDRAVRVALDGIEGARDVAPAYPQRLEHIQLVREADVGRFARLGVVASMQPIHATSDRDVADRYWGARCARAYPWRALRDAGVTLAFGSDAPVEPIDPLYGIHAAVTRKRPTDADPWHPEQRIGVAEALRGYTLGPAEALRRERELGTLEEGKWCDAVVLAEDLFRVGPDEIRDIGVRATITAGEVRHADGIG